MKALDFLKTKELNLNVWDYCSENDFFKFNSKNHNDEFFENNVKFDFDDFMFNIYVKIWFDFEASHKTSSAENDEEKNLEILGITKCFIEISEVQEWNGEEMQKVILSEAQIEELEKYIKENIKLNA